MKETGIVLSIFGAIACSIILGVVMASNCECNHAVITKHKHKHKKQIEETQNTNEDENQTQEQQQYNGPHLSILPIGPKLFGPFHLGF